MRGVSSTTSAPMIRRSARACRSHRTRTTALQTVTWLVDGIVEHHDSLGSHTGDRARTAQSDDCRPRDRPARKYTPPEHPPLVHGLQLWIALPDDVRNDPTTAFEHHTSPAGTTSTVRATITVVVGELAGTSIPGPSAQSTRCGTSPVHPRRRPTACRSIPPSNTAFMVMSKVQPRSPTLISSLDRCSTSARIAGGRRSRRPDRPGYFLLGGATVRRAAGDVVELRRPLARRDRRRPATTGWLGGASRPVAGCTADPLPAPALPSGRLKSHSEQGVTGSAPQTAVQCGYPSGPVLSCSRTTAP